MQENEYAHRIADAALDTKAEEVLLYDLQNRSSVTDYIIICTGRSQAHVRGISDKIAEKLKADGHPASTVEGYSEGSWVLLDFGDVIAHIFHPETRAFYDLEGLLKGYPHERIAPPDLPAGTAPGQNSAPA